jgi:5'-deoxynucleotidase YfbR-like HD superfamily hydrolase
MNNVGSPDETSYHVINANQQRMNMPFSKSHQSKKMPKQSKKEVLKSYCVPEPRAWQRMLSGRRLDILNPSPLDVEIEDIAHGLARVTRWNGQTRGKYGFSVAQHCVLVEFLVRLNAPKTDQKWCLAALLHDAPEYVIGDMITPFKYALGGIYRDIEHRLDLAVSIRFGLPPQLPEAVQRTIKRADRMAAWIEATQIAGFSKDEAAKIFVKPSGTPSHIKLHVQTPANAAAHFLRRFAILGGKKKQN